MKATLTVLFVTLSLSSLQARDFGRSRTITSGRGTGTRVVSGSVNQGSGLVRGTTTTGAQGRSVMTSQQVVKNASGNGRTISGSVTGPQGKTATTSGSVTRADGTRTAVRSVTGPEGQTKSVTNTTTRP